MKNSCFRVFLFIFLIISISSVFAANGDIKGVVLDAETGRPLQGANITLEGTELGASADVRGHFIISGVPKGSYKIRASMMGYEEKRSETALSGSGEVIVNFNLRPTVLQLQPVTVTGKSERNLMEKPALESSGLELAVSTIRQREIKRQGAKTVIDALKYIPGALIETRGRKIKQFFSIRGQRYPYPEYAVNGAWQREFLETPYFFSAADIEQVKVIRSSAALLMGINGMAGVINIITKEYEKSETTREIEYGTFGTYRAHISHGAKIGDLSYATGLGTQHTDGPAGMHAVEGMMNFYGSVHWTPSEKLSVRYNLFHLNGKRELRLAEPPAAKRFLTELWSFDPVRSTLANLKINYKLSDKAATEFLAYYTNRDPVFIDEDEVTHEIKKVSERDHEWGINLIQSLALSKKNTLRIGGLLNHWVAPNGKRFYQGRRSDLQTVSAVVVDEHRIGALNLDGGIRWAKTYINEYGTFGINGSGKGFSKVEPIKDQWQPAILQASFGAAYSFPNLFTLNINMAAGEIKPLPGTLDVNLREPLNERRLKLDAGVRKLLPHIGQFSLVGFVTQQKNAIVLSGKTFDAPSRFMELYLNRDQDQYGLEFEVRLAQMFKSMQAFFNATAMSSRAEKDGDMQRNRELPQFISSGGLYFQHGGFDATILGKYVSSFQSTRFAAKPKDGPAVPQPLGDFITLDVNLGWTMGKTYFTRFYLETKNLTDQAYSTVVGYPDFGRTITVGLRQTFK